MLTKQIFEIDNWIFEKEQDLERVRAEFDRQSNDANNRLGSKITTLIDEIEILQKCKKLLTKGKR